MSASSYAHQAGLWHLILIVPPLGAHVFKCKLSREGGQEWVEVKCLGEWVLFLGENLSLALSTKHFPELTPNSIYFTHNRVNKHVEREHRTDMGVFHLVSRIVEPVLDDDEASRRLLKGMTRPLPIWIPHAECFPLVSQFKEDMAEEITKRITKRREEITKKRTEVPVTKAIRREHRYVDSVSLRRMTVKDCPPKFYLACF